MLAHFAFMPSDGDPLQRYGSFLLALPPSRRQRYFCCQKDALVANLDSWVAACPSWRCAPPKNVQLQVTR